MEFKESEGFFLYGSVCKDFFTIKTMLITDTDSEKMTAKTVG